MSEILVYISGTPKLVDYYTSEFFHLINSGKVHRDSNEGPAICYPDGTEEYYEHGKLHRLNGPASCYPNGVFQYYFNGKLHRLDGPAVIQPNRLKVWYNNGYIHRLDGAAIEWNEGLKEYYIMGVKYLYKQWLEEREKWLKH